MGTVGVNPPKTPVTEGSHGVAAATLPNVCKMPGPPAPFVPTPLPNIGNSGNSPKGYSKSVTIEGKAVAIQGASFGSSGDIASKGTGGGIASMNVEGPTRFVGPGSMDVHIEGKNVQLLGDQMLNNCGPSGSPANSATMTGLIQVTSIPDVGDPEKCPNCKATTGKNKSDGKPYDEFFSETERAELDKIGQENPDLVAMLPPKGSWFKIRSEYDTKRARRDQYEKKKKAGMKGEYHHPHPIKVGGCPIHQELVLKPDKEPEMSRVQAVDDQINAVVNRAIERNK
ncbi:MAG TPA: PAAR-like domain-containing protein [Archangium sp.]|nr:PAAR-like domain-containing protein [Archangium sp.]